MIAVVFEFWLAGLPVQATLSTRLKRLNCLRQLMDIEILLRCLDLAKCLFKTRREQRLCQAVNLCFYVVARCRQRSCGSICCHQDRCWYSYRPGYLPAAVHKPRLIRHHLADAIVQAVIITAGFPARWKDLPYQGAGEVCRICGIV